LASALPSVFVSVSGLRYTVMAPVGRY